MGKDRKRAIALKAADARQLIGKDLPLVLKHMTQTQVDQVQRVLDAAVVNPAVEKEYVELRNRSVVARSGDLVMRDERLVQRAERVLHGFTPLNDNDRRVKIDFEKLLDPDTFKPTTDNPDEARYLGKVKAVLEKQGVWLRFEQQLIRDPEDPSRMMIDPRTFQVWLSVGREGDTIPTEKGLLNRKAILDTQVFGAGYYDEVHRGPVERALEKETNRLFAEIESGREQHNMLAKIRREAFPGVAAASDLLGGADFPDRSIWDHPFKLVLTAMDHKVGGNVSVAQAYLVVAAIATRNAAQLLADYIDDTGQGAERAVTILKVVVVAGTVAEVGLFIMSGGASSLVRAGAKTVGTKAVTKTAKDKAIDEAAEKMVGRMLSKDPSLANDLAQVRWVPGPKGTTLGRGVKPGQSTGHGGGFERWP